MATDAAHTVKSGHKVLTAHCAAASFFHNDAPRLCQRPSHDFGDKHAGCVIALQRLSKLMRLIAGSKCGDAKHGSQPDVAAAAAAVGLLVAQQPAARAGLLQLRGLKPLLALLHQGSLAEQSVAANVLFDMSQGTLLPPLLTKILLCCCSATSSTDCNRRLSAAACCGHQAKPLAHVLPANPSFVCFLLVLHLCCTHQHVL